MKDWFYADGSEIVSSSGDGIVKSKIVVTIRRGYKTIAALEEKLGVHFSESEMEDVKDLLKIYSPMCYDSLGGCSSCGGC